MGGEQKVRRTRFFLARMGGDRLRRGIDCGQLNFPASDQAAASDALEKRLWAAADQLRANSELKA